MKFKIGLLIVVSLFSVSALLGQSKLFILKDSTFFEGQIVNQYEDQLIINTGIEVLSVHKDEVLSTYKTKTVIKNYESKLLTFQNITDIGVLAGKRDGNEKYSFSFNMVNGVEYKERFSAGLGFGIEFMDINVIPVFGDIRYTINKGDLQCFVGMQAGYVLPLEKSEDDLNWNDYIYEKGFFYNPMVGFKANFNKSKNAFIVSLGFRHMNIVGERWDDWWVDTRYEREFIYDRVSFRVGYVFN